MAFLLAASPASSAGASEAPAGHLHGGLYEPSVVRSLTSTGRGANSLSGDVPDVSILVSVCASDAQKNALV